jgi:excisionase family DNA binding protein
MLNTQPADSRTIWMSRAEVARVLQVAPVTIGRWASQGKLPHSLTLGGRRRFRRDDIEAVARQLTMIMNASPPATDSARPSDPGVRPRPNARTASSPERADGRKAVRLRATTRSLAERASRSPKAARHLEAPVAATSSDRRPARTRRARSSTFARPADRPERPGQRVEHTEPG